MLRNEDDVWSVFSELNILKFQMPVSSDSVVYKGADAATNVSSLKLYGVQSAK